MNWGLGHYERTAAQLLPTAEVLVDVAAPAEAERVVDLGCGTGNAALIAAKRGAQVIGVDPAPRLLEVAKELAGEGELDITFLQGEAASIPLEDEAADLLLSVFGVIFAPDAGAAAAEMARVTSASGRIVLSAWIPKGAISEAAKVGREAVADALNAPQGPPPFAWYDAEALAGLLGPYGFEVSAEEHRHTFTAGSAQEWVEAETRNHPLGIAGTAVLQSSGKAEAVKQRTLEIFEAANEDPDGFKVTSHYIVATARRG